MSIRLPLRVISTAALLGLILMPLLAVANPAHGPVIFVHGYGGKSGQFDSMIRDFQNNGYPSGNLYRFSYSSLTVSNRTSADQLRSYVNTVRSRHGNARVNIVAHSNGGLVSRWYRVHLGGTNASRRFVTLGTPHRGTTWAWGCVSPACFEMRPNSTFLQQLNGLGCERSLWSSCDAIILPNSSAQCGSSTWIGCRDHNLMLSNSSVQQTTRQQLQ
jgi:triacylglycerol lipase